MLWNQFYEYPSESLFESPFLSNESIEYANGNAYDSLFHRAIHALSRNTPEHSFPNTQIHRYLNIVNNVSKRPYKHQHTHKQAFLHVAI